jgi:hypothetical protein
MLIEDFFNMDPKLIGETEFWSSFSKERLHERRERPYGFDGNLGEERVTSLFSPESRELPRLQLWAQHRRGDQLINGELLRRLPHGHPSLHAKRARIGRDNVKVSEIATPNKVEGKPPIFLTLRLIAIGPA